MAEMRALELALADLWGRGLISGELHLGVGEEGVVAGVVDHLRDGDSMALDHRSTPPLVARGTDLIALVSELLGSADGLCRGFGGHMHLFDPARLAASSGIVGSSGPMACGFGLAHQQQGGDRLAVAMFGEGAANQGMLLESLNLASVWRLPVVFICKDNGWAITTRSARMTGGNLIRRARAFGLPAVAVDGSRPWTVWTAAGRAVQRARRGRGPSFLLARVHRPRGHFEGDPLVRIAGEPRELVAEARGLRAEALGEHGGRPRERVGGVAVITRTLAAMIGEQVLPHRDPLNAAAGRLDRRTVAAVDAEVRRSVHEAVSAALATIGVTP